MDPNTGKVYSSEEIKDLPKEVQDRLVPYDTSSNTNVPTKHNPPSRKVRRTKKEQVYFNDPGGKYKAKRREKSKAARKARRNNR